jgi:hypothetical protein
MVGTVCALNVWFVNQVTGQTYSSDNPRGLMDYSAGGVSSGTSGGTMSGGSTSGGSFSQ